MVNRRSPLPRAVARALALPLALAFAALAGCGPPAPNEPETCDEINEATVARYEGCGIPVTPAPPQDEWTADEECLLQCNWPCNRDAPCGALDGTDGPAAAQRLTCLVACNDLCL